MSAWNDYDNVVKNEIPVIIKTFEKFLKPQKHGFELIFAGVPPESPPCLLYQSRQVKLKVMCVVDRPYESTEMYLDYGRLHAPINKNVMEWNGEKCRCWHSLESDHVLNFLDGLSARDVENPQFRLHPIMEEFQHSGQAMGQRPEYLARKHAFIWTRYGGRIFNLFDLEHPDLWSDYTRYLEEYYINREEIFQKRKMPTIPFDPPRFKVC